jgi:peptide deformylase
MRLPIIYYGNPLLRKRCEPIEKITDEIKQLAADMLETMDIENGIGLAAIQVGKLVRLFVCRSYIETPNGEWTVTEPKVYINPKLTDHSQETIEDTEGCLSIPGIKESVERPLKVTVEALDLNGQVFKEELEGYNARIRMHENDHLNGVLFIDRLDIHTKNKLDPFLQEIKKKYNK